MREDERSMLLPRSSMLENRKITLKLLDCACTCGEILIPVYDMGTFNNFEAFPFSILRQGFLS